MSKLQKGILTLEKILPVITEFVIDGSGLTACSVLTSTGQGSSVFFLIAAASSFLASVAKFFLKEQNLKRVI